MENTVKSRHSRRTSNTPGLFAATDGKTDAPIFREIGSPEELFDRNAVVEDLRRVDWAFTEDDTTFLSHDIHPYPAKFIPQIPGHLIARLSLRGDLVFDPFGGSGTTALEAVRLGRRAIVVDANRVGILAGRVKTCRLKSETERDLRAIRNVLLARQDNLPPAPDLLAKYAGFVPDVPNRSKWFPDTSCAELALIRAQIARLETVEARDIASLAMSRIILRASFQDSETRYTVRSRTIEPGEVLALYVRALDSVVQDVRSTAWDVRYGVATFIEGDARHLSPETFPDQSVDLVVTSPPYGNATDYHLYHRFRLFWLGADPCELARIEIGSHLRHQRESTGHDSYRDEMQACLCQMARVLRPGRYAAIVIGDSVYGGVTYDGAEMIERLGLEAGLEHVTTLRRAIHRTKRSFVAAGRRATSEVIVVLQRPAIRSYVFLAPAPYRLWPYEEVLRRREIEALAGGKARPGRGGVGVNVDRCHFAKLRRLTFSHTVIPAGHRSEQTWQAILENGLAFSEAARKDPKYVTHGIHPYKGKFYPQLAKSLINVVGLRPGAVVLDPFCGSGTTLLEGYLNGLSSHGCDLNPLAAKIARCKLGVLELDPGLVSDAVKTLLDKLAHAPSRCAASMDQVERAAHEEIVSWFPGPVIGKMNWLLGAIRSVSAGILQDFFEVVLSSIIRDVSQQEPTDLRIRRRKTPLTDADVLGTFREALGIQYNRIERFWSIRGYCPYPFFKPLIVEGDCRAFGTLERCGVKPASVDLVLTSPPYATALPYIDTDRLSILVLCGLNASARKPLEHGLTGSREITKVHRRLLEEQLDGEMASRLPKSVTAFVRGLYRQMTEVEVGFRRRNMPALLARFFDDMQSVLANVQTALKPGADAMVVMGSNATSVGEDPIPIPTSRLVADVALDLGLDLVEEIPITVTTENLVHIKNAIRGNVVLRLRKSR
jgi:DNA modification methylase